MLGTWGLLVIPENSWEMPAQGTGLKALGEPMAPIVPDPEAARSSVQISVLPASRGRWFGDKSRELGRQIPSLPLSLQMVLIGGSG